MNTTATAFSPFSGLTETLTHPRTGDTLTGRARREYLLAVARMASCPDQRMIDSLPQARRAAVEQSQADARRVVAGLPPVTAPVVLTPAQQRMRAAHGRVYPGGCTSPACRYGC